MSTRVWMCTCALVDLWRSRDNLVELFFFFLDGVSGVWTLAVGLSWQALSYLLSHLSGPVWWILSMLSLKDRGSLVWWWCGPETQATEETEAGKPLELQSLELGWIMKWELDLKQNNKKPKIRTNKQNRKRLHRHNENYPLNPHNKHYFALRLWKRYVYIYWKKFFSSK